MKKFIVFLDGAKEIVIVNGIIKYIRGISIKIVQYFTELVRIEDRIWSSVDKHGRLVVVIHVEYELTVNINEWKDVGNGIWVVDNF